MKKRCSKCGEEKLFEAFSRDSNPRNRYGLQSRCRLCQVEAASQYAREHPEWAKEQKRKYAKRHPDRIAAAQKKKREKRPEHYRMLDAQRTRRYRLRNPGRGLKGNAERLKRWRKRHPEREKSWQAARRIILKRIPSWGDPALMETVYAKAKQYKFEVDHIVPIKHKLVCGLHVWQNLQLLDRNLNREKRNRVWPNMPTED